MKSNSPLFAYRPDLVNHFWIIEGGRSDAAWFPG